MIVRAAETRPSSYREEDNSLEVCWSTGAAVTRFDWWNGEYYNEELSLDEGAVRLDRLNSGAAVLDTHSQFRLSSVIGSVEPGSARIENGLGIARVRLSDTPDCADTVAKIVAGHIRNISVGYIVHQYTRTERDGERPVMRADDWEPVEISFVPVPADGGAQVRSQNAEQGGFPCTIRGVPAASNEGNHMPAETISQGAPAGNAGQRQTPTPPASGVATEQRQPPALTAGRIRDVVGRSDLGADFALDLIARNEETPMSEADLTDAIAGQLETTRQNGSVNGNNAVYGAVASGDQFRSAIEGALLSRNQRPSQVSEDARQFRGMGLIELARFYLHAQGQRTLGMRKEELFVTACRFGAHGTSDFGAALQNVARTSLLQGYEEAEQTFWDFVTRKTLPDFKPDTLVGLATLSPFLLVEENAEFKRLNAESMGDTVQLSTYGGIFAVTRQAIVNDNAGIFVEIPNEMGYLAADHESDTIYAILTGNQMMYDGKALFHVDHGNLAAAGTAITIEAIGAGRAAMSRQRSPSGRNIGGNYPKYLVTGPNKQTEAEQVVSAITAADATKANPFAGKLVPITDPRITDNSWYLLADARRSGIVAGYLEGQEEVFLDTREGFDVDGTEWKGRLDYVGKAIDYRGAYKNPGN
ncbi:MAG TPA: prohead protease/major capsid protein fusion protein [Novosphingobium sp.]|nr:prohead protease/major capsid protein fusion protein [Novosphingobium sp.]